MMRRVLAQLAIAGALLLGMSPERAHAQRVADAVVGVAQASHSIEHAPTRMAAGDECEDRRVHHALVGALVGGLIGALDGAVLAPLVEPFDSTAPRRFMVYGAILGAVLGASTPPPQCPP